MSRALTNDELTLLRTDTQFTKLYLAVHKPNVIYTALLNGTPASNDQVYEIAFDNGSGTLGDVVAGMTLYVGTSAGDFDLGMCRIRKAPIAGTFYLGLTSEIDWQDNAHLTVVDDFDLWPKHATISDESLSMDVDIAYSNQHSSFNPVPIMGPHAVVWLDGATVNVPFNASESWVHGSTISGYAWSAPGASASSGMTSATPTITYNAAGIYRVYLTVTAANGKTTTGVRHVFVYDRDENGPLTVFQLAQCYADYDAGGWMFDMEMQAEAGLSDLRDRSLVVLFAEDWYGTTKQSIGPVANRENIVCVGRVVGESIRWDSENGSVHFTAHGAQHWLGRIKAFPVEMQFATDTPDSWSVMPAMTVDRALWHILYWHSTAVETMDFRCTGDTRYLPEGKTLASNIWGQLQDIAMTRLLASCGVDRFGRLFAQIDPQMTPEADRDWATVMTITSSDWAEEINLQRVTVQDVSLITLSSQLCDASGAVNTLYSLSPGHVPLRYGEPMAIDRVLAASQSESNSLAGLALGWHTNPFPEVPVSLAHNNRMIDMWPRQFCALEIAEADTPRGIAFDGNLIPRRISLLFDGNTGWMHPEINFEAETFEMVNADGDVPDVEDMSIPPFPTINFPDLPPLSPVFPGDASSTPSGPPVVLMLDAAKGVLRTENFNADSNDVIWQFWNTGIASADIPYVGRFDNDQRVIFHICPNGAVYLGIHAPSREQYVKIYRAPAIGAAWQVVINNDWIEENEGENGGILGFGINPNKAEEVAFIAASDIGLGETTKHIYIGNAYGWTQGDTPPSIQRYYGNMTFGGNEWVWSMPLPLSGYWYRFTADGSYIDRYQYLREIGTKHHVRAGTSPFIAISKSMSNLGLIYSIDNGQNQDETSMTSPDVLGNNLAISPDGYMMGDYNTSANKGRSSDFGATWGAMGSLNPGGVYSWTWCGGAGVSSRWIAARANIWFSPDWGDSWQDKDGNMPYLIPLSPTILKTIVPGYYA